MYEMDIFSLDYLCCKQYRSKCLIYSVLLFCFECQSMVSMGYRNSTFFSAVGYNLYEPSSSCFLGRYKQTNQPLDGVSMSGSCMENCTLIAREDIQQCFLTSNILLRVVGRPFQGKFFFNSIKFLLFYSRQSKRFFIYPFHVNIYLHD